MNKDKSVLALELSNLVAEGERLNDLIRVDPMDRPDMNCNGALEIQGVMRYGHDYVVTAHLPRALKFCPHCGSVNITLHGRFFAKLADLPYIDADGRVRPVTYSITVQRYQCNSCMRGTADVMPESVAAAVTTSRITRRLSCWLLFMLRTETSYEDLSRMTGYSKVWVRKWYTEVRDIYDLGAKPARPGRRPSVKPPASDALTGKNVDPDKWAFSEFAPKPK